MIHVPSGSAWGPGEEHLRSLGPGSRFMASWYLQDLPCELLRCDESCTRHKTWQSFKIWPLASPPPPPSSHWAGSRSLESPRLCTCRSCSPDAVPLWFVGASPARPVASSDPLGSSAPSSELPELLVVPLLALMSLT